MQTRLGPAASVHPTAEVRASLLGRYTEVGARTSLVETTLGDYSYVVNDADIIHAMIGKFVSIAAHTRINPGNHPMQRASQSHFSYRASAYFEGEADEEDFFAWRRSFPVTIGHDAWIGHGAVILPGRTIGNGAVVGAGSIVTRDVAPYSIVVGNPAKEIRLRFPEPTCERLQALCWWDWDHARLQEALPDFRNLAIEGFLEKYGR